MVRAIVVAVILVVLIGGGYLIFHKGNDTTPAPNPLASAQNPQTPQQQPPAPPAPKTPETPKTPPAQVKPPAPEPRPDAAQEYKKLMQDGKDYEAREALAGITKGTVSDQVTAEMIADMKALNEKLIFSTSELRDAELYPVKSGDVLVKIAQKHKTEHGQLMFVNRLKSDRLQIGQKIKVLHGKFSVVVSKSRFTLYLMYKDTVFKEYGVGIGKDNKTPAGTFTIATKMVKPDWTRTNPENGRKEKIKYGDPQNVLGERWMGFEGEHSSYGIHGTTQPETIRTAASQGCVRMLNDEVTELYDIIPAGTKVTIVE